MKVLILGCGWVGEEFALHMLSSGNEVWASVTNQEKADRLSTLGIQAFVLNFDKELQLFAEMPIAFDYILTSVPASSKHDDVTIHNRFANVHSFLERVEYSKHIFLSSIGVYPDIDFTFDESYPIDAHQRLAIAENKMQELLSTVVYRLGGLFGKNRIFAKYFQNRICITGDQLANFVHLDDVIALIIKGFATDLKASIYNVLSPEHPTKKEVVLASAKKYGFDNPSEFSPENSFQKIVTGSKIAIELDYHFRYPSPLAF